VRNIWETAPFTFVVNHPAAPLPPPPMNVRKPLELGGYPEPPEVRVILVTEGDKETFTCEESTKVHPLYREDSGRLLESSLINVREL